MLKCKKKYVSRETPLKLDIKFNILYIINAQ